MRTHTSRHTALALLTLLVTISKPTACQETHHRVPDATDLEASKEIQEHDENLERNARIRGSIKLPNGDPPYQMLEIIARCPSFSRLLAIADSRGRFSVSFGPNLQSDITLTDGCVLETSAEGYRSQPVSLSGLSTKGGRNLGTIVLQPISSNLHGLTSASDSQATERQTKSYLSALDKASRQDWKHATAILLSLISENPRFSSAWLNLGIIRQIEGDRVEAEKSYLKAVEIDPSFVLPLIRAAALESATNKQQASVINAQRAITINPSALPHAYLLHAVGALSSDPHSAEKSAREGLALDSFRQYPELEYVLGTILCGRDERNEARVHLQKYIEEAPSGANVFTAHTQLERMRLADMAARRASVASEHRGDGPMDLVSTEGSPTFLSGIRYRNGPLLSNMAAYTCLESVLATKRDVNGRVFPTETSRADVAVLGRREIFGPADGKQFSQKTSAGLLGSTFNTTGVFSSIARMVVDGEQLVITPAGQFSVDGEVVRRYNFHSVSGTAGWRIEYGNDAGNAAEEGWFVVASNTLILRRVFVRATNIPKTLRLSSLDVLIDYESQTLAGHRVLLPNLATVQAGENNGEKRTEFVSFDHCHVFSSTSVVSFSDFDSNKSKKEVSRPARLPRGLEIVVSVDSPVNLMGDEVDSDVLSAIVAQPVVRNGHEVVGRGAAVEGHIWALRGETAVVVQLDRIQTKNGWVPFYAQLLSVGAMAFSNAKLSSESATSDESGDITTGMEIPGVATVFTDASKQLERGTRMVWKTERLSPAHHVADIPEVGTSLGLK